MSVVGVLDIPSRRAHLIPHILAPGNLPLIGGKARFVASVTTHDRNLTLLLLMMRFASTPVASLPLSVPTNRSNLPHHTTGVLLFGSLLVELQDIFAKASAHARERSVEINEMIEYLRNVSFNELAAN